MTDEIRVFMTPNTYEQGAADKDYAWRERIRKAIEEVEQEKAWMHYVLTDPSLDNIWMRFKDSLLKEVGE